jgi:hypothetical protein
MSLDPKVASDMSYMLQNVVLKRKTILDADSHRIMETCTQNAGSDRLLFVLLELSYKHTVPSVRLSKSILKTSVLIARLPYLSFLFFSLAIFSHRWAGHNRVLSAMLVVFLGSRA